MSEEQGKDSASTFSIGVVSRLKHGAFLEALNQRGWNQTQGADFFGISPTAFGKLINMQWVPKRISAGFERKLFEFTGKLANELWPEEVFTEQFLGASKKRVLIRDVPVRVLQATLSAQQLPPAQPDEELEQVERNAAIEKALALLTPREQRVLRGRFFEDKTLEQVARDLGLQRERARQIEGKALRKLRDPSRSRLLKPFIMPR